MKTVTTDRKRWIVVPNAEPGKISCVREIEPGHLELTKMVPGSQNPKSPTKLRAIFEDDPLTPSMSWESLKRSTRGW